MAIKVALLLSLAAVTALFIVTIFAGRAMQQKLTQSLKKHRRLARLSFFSMLALVVVIETIVRIKGGVETDLLFYIHLGFAVLFLSGLVILNFWLTGLKRKDHHAAIAYLLCVFFLGTLSTGIPMVLRLQV